MVEEEVEVVVRVEGVRAQVGTKVGLVLVSGQVVEGGSNVEVQDMARGQRFLVQILFQEELDLEVF